MAEEVVVDALPYIDHGYDDPGVRYRHLFISISLKGQCHEIFDTLVYFILTSVLGP
jgi:hypothetical protein